MHQRTLTAMVTDSFPMLVADDEVVSERDLLNGVENGVMMESADSVRYIILHCSATPASRDYTAEQLIRDHRRRGFRTAGYHFYIRRSGAVTQHRKLLEAGAHCRPYNRCSIGICYEGGLDARGVPADTRTPQQKERLTALLLRLHRLFPRARIRGHCDMPHSVPKSCPCFDAHEYQWIETMAMG